MQLEAFRKRYPDAPKIGGWIEIYCRSVKIDASFEPSELRELADFSEKVETDFINWYNEIREIDPEMEDEPVNAYWHDFVQGKTPLESYSEIGHLYGRKN
jgi:hypothetical protein